MKITDKDQKRITALENLILTANVDYYIKDEPKVPDSTYDNWIIELRGLYGKYNINKVVKQNWFIQETFVKGKHHTPMLSLRTETDVTINPISAWFIRTGLINQAEEVIIENKYDGLGLSLTYTDGVLVRVLTRGDGECGEDVTTNAQILCNLPTEIEFKGELEIRGETVMTLEEFKRVNKQLEENNKKPLVNPRNAAAGTIRQLDLREIRERKLLFLAYSLNSIDNTLKLTTQSEALEVLKSWGFNVGDYFITRDIDEIKRIHSLIMSRRDNFRYEIDGVVYKFNDLNRQKELGYSGREPKWAIAHKFPPQEVETTLLGIDVQVGRTGKLTPVARLEPVLVGGVTVSNATLFNQNIVDLRRLSPGIRVVVRRAGDVIPEVINYNTEQSPPAWNLAEALHSVCPSCGSEIWKEGVDWYCTGGINCPDQKQAMFEHFVSRNAVFISGLGPSLISLLLSNKLINDFPDLYKLKYEDLVKLPDIGDRTARNILESIENSKKQLTYRVLYGMGIRFIGEETAKLIGKNFNIVDYFSKPDYISREAFCSLDDIGFVKADSLKRSAERINSLLQQFTKLGFRFIELESSKTSLMNQLFGKKLSNHTFVITGTLPESRGQIKSKLEELGAKVVGSVTSNATFVLVGESPSVNKLLQAEVKNIPVINYQQLMEMIK
jgi:DNA ligase (NAD+)